MTTKTIITEVGARLALPPPDECKALLRIAGVSNARVAAELGRNRVTVSRWVNGTRTPRGEDLVAFVGFLGDLSEVVGAMALAGKVAP